MGGHTSAQADRQQRIKTADFIFNCTCNSQISSREGSLYCGLPLIMLVSFFCFPIHWLTLEMKNSPKFPTPVKTHHDFFWLCVEEIMIWYRSGFANWSDYMHLCNRTNSEERLSKINQNLQINMCDNIYTFQRISRSIDHLSMLSHLFYFNLNISNFDWGCSMDNPWLQF